MTKRERFLAFADFEPVDRIPRRATYIPELQRTLAEFLGEDPVTRFDMDAGHGRSLRAPAGCKAPDYSSYHRDYVGRPGFSIDENGCGHLGHGYHHFTEYISPLRNASSFSELEEYPYPDKTGWFDDDLRAAGEAAHADGDFAWVFAGHIYESAWQVRGYEEFLVDLLTRRDWAEFILDKFCANSAAVAVAAARAGYDCLKTGDDVANQNSMMFHPDLWREVMKPRWARVIAAARAFKPDIHVWYHSDGNVLDILDDLVEIGVTILNPVQPECMDPLQVRKRMGSRLAFDGCVGTQTTFPFGTPAEMRDAVRNLAVSMNGLNGGLMLSPTHVLEPDIPPANVVAFFEECDLFHRSGV
jgi:uroporphyrinogen decarboxylase